MRGPLTWPKVVGSLLVLIGILGFFTIADDVRHVGEILGVGTVLVIGLLLRVAGSTRSASIRAAAFYLSGALGIGGLVGTAMDHMELGIGGGLTVGVVLAAMATRHRARASG